MTYTISIISAIIAFIALRKFIDYEKARYRKLLSQKKSSEVVLGQISEVISPFIDSFPAKNQKDVNFLGMPIDFIYFGEDEVVFIEVKSGKSRLSKKQRKIRDQIKDGKVSFTTYRIPENLKK
jgi:predicted Holliday junction resolvase-like endonuclease